MENLNDAEFGSGKEGEEAPILVAQRYLNIFRQVHIFNKAKRDQFDDELLALPTNISDFFKKMPGGRLLVEHIEEVKTERGISFVKSNKEDFTGGYGGDASSESSSSSTATGGPIVGGNLVLGESFAETFSKSMAEAFKQLPTAIPGTPISGGNVSVDLGNAFDVLAEEIRTSRTSLLDVLKETRSITDTVIASQVSISRILEGILSARSRDESDVANLNNRIIASQTSISKILESLYTNNAKLPIASSSSIDIENRLQDFKREIKQEIDSSINKLQKLIESINQESVNSFTNNTERNTANLSQKLNTNIENDNLSAGKKKKKKKKNNTASDVALLASTPVVSEVIADDFIQDDIKPIDATIHNSAFKHHDNFDHINLNEPPFEEDLTVSGIDEDTIDDLDFSLPEQIVDADIEEDNTPLPVKEEGLDSFDDDDLEFTLPESNSATNEEDTNMKFSNNNDVIDQGTSELSSSVEDFSSEVDESLELSFNDILSDFSDNEQKETIEEDNTDTSFDDVKLEEFDSFSETNDTFADDSSNLELNIDDNAEIQASNDEQPLTDELSATEEEYQVDDFSNYEDNPQSKFNEILDNLSFENDEPIDIKDITQGNDENISIASKESDLEDNDIDLNSFIENTETDVNDEKTEIDLDELTLDSFEDNTENNIENINNEETLDNIDFSNNEEQSDTLVSLDDIVDNTEISEEEIVTEDNVTQSRYSAELDKIREALTSDNVDLSSLDEPIALDEYSDDENLDEDASSATDDEDWEYEYVEEQAPSNSEIDIANSTEDNTDNSEASTEEWEWEYVDENGNPVTSSEDEDWEWEYVEEDEETDNKEQ